MSLLANLQANDPIPTNPVPSFLNNSAVVNQTGQQVLNNPLQGNTGVFSN